MFLRLALLVERFAHCICLPPRGAVRNLLWLASVSICILVSAAGTLHAQSASDKLSIPMVKASVGGSVNTTVSFAGKGEGVAALQFDLQYDRAAFTITATPGAATTNAGKSLATHDLPSGVTRFVITGFRWPLLVSGALARTPGCQNFNLPL
jgi:hypothetical protein